MRISLLKISSFAVLRVLYTPDILVNSKGILLRYFNVLPYACICISFICICATIYIWYMYILGILMHTYKNVIKISNQKYTIANIKCCIDY